MAMNTQLSDLLNAFNEHIREVATEVLAAQLTPQHITPDVSTLEADDIRARLYVIKAKEFVSIPEAALLLNCSNSHLRNLITKAREGEAEHPIPHRDLDGVTVFNREQLLAWVELDKRVKAGKLTAVRRR